MFSGVEEAGPSYRRSSPEQEQGRFPVTSVHAVEETVMELTEDSTIQSEEMTEQEATVSSPLDEIMPMISTETVQPLFMSFWDRLGTLELKTRESREELAEMFLEVISSLANMILEALRNLVLDGTESPLQVSEEAVGRAMHRSLRESFKSAAGSSNQATKSLCTLLSAEVTSHINSVLCCSRVKGQRLLLSEDSDYSPPKDTMKAMMRNVREMLRSIQKKVTQCCQSQASPEDELSQAENQVQPPPRRLQAFKQQLGRSCLPCGSGEASPEDQVSVNSCEGGDRSSSPSVREATTEVREMLLQEALKLSTEDLTSLSEHSQDTASAIVNHIVEESTQSTISLTAASHKVKAFFTMSFAKGTLRGILTSLCCCANVKPDVSTEEVMDQASPLLQQLIQEDIDVYVTLPKTIEQQELELSEELTDVISHSMALVKHRPAFRKHVRIHVKVFMDTMSVWIQNQTQLPVLRDPVQRVLARISRLISRMSQPRERSQRLMLPSTDEQLQLHPQPKQSVFPKTQLQVPRYTPRVSTSTQQHEPVMFRELTPPSVHSAPRQIPPVHSAPRQIPPVHSAPRQTPPLFPGALPASQGPSAVWSNNDCSSLICEVVSRIFRTKWRPDRPEMVALSKDLMQQLTQQVHDWNVRVEPSQRSYQDVADAVYKDLCKGFKSSQVIYEALTKNSFSDTVLKSICFHLEVPRTKRTVGSNLRSAWGAICRCF